LIVARALGDREPFDVALDEVRKCSAVVALASKLDFVCDPAALAYRAAA